jgi:hypothetical protein
MCDPNEFTDLMSRVFGHSEEEAVQILRGESAVFRIVQRDNNPYIITRDWNPNRLNLVIRDGLVTGISRG